MEISHRLPPTARRHRPAVVVFEDKLETDTGRWLLRGPWARQETPGHGFAYHDSPDGPYAPDANVRLVSQPFRLDVAEPVLQYCLAHETEPGADQVTVEIAENHPHRHDWKVLEAADGVSGWRQGEVSLAGFEGKEVQIRFRLTSDGQNQYAGLWVDDVVVGGSAPLEAPRGEA